MSSPLLKILSNRNKKASYDSLRLHNDYVNSKITRFRHTLKLAVFVYGSGFDSVVFTFELYYTIS